MAKKGDMVEFRIVPEPAEGSARTAVAKVIGTGRDKGRRILFLESGDWQTWCVDNGVLTDVVRIIRD